MWPNEYKQCVLSAKGEERLVWMPINGARPSAAVDLDDDGTLWEVVSVADEPIFDLETVKGLTTNGWSENRYVEGYHGQTD